jgi:hypothetical protein
MHKLKKDFECILRDTDTGKDLLAFTAQQVGDPLFSAGFEGGGVASASQNMTIETETKFDYVPYKHEVYVDGKRWTLTSFYPSIRRRHGAGWARKPRAVFVLNLE